MGTVSLFLGKLNLVCGNIVALEKQKCQDGPVSLTWLLDKFESAGLSVQEKKFNIDFQDGGHLGFPLRTILATFELQVTSILPIKFPVNCFFGLGEKGQNRPAWISDQNEFSYSGEEVQNRFSRHLWHPSCISDQNNFSYFWSTSHPDASYHVFSKLAFRFRTRSAK